MILNRQRRVRLVLQPLDAFFAQVRRATGLPAGAVTVCLVSDAAIARLNETFRGKRGPTDVLSFPADGRFAKKSRIRGMRRARRSATLAGPVAYLGDVAISPETARRNARRLGRPLEQELKILLLHGVLHLLGYDHEADYGEMERCETRLRRRLGLR